VPSDIARLLAGEAQNGIGDLARRSGASELGSFYLHCEVDVTVCGMAVWADLLVRLLNERARLGSLQIWNLDVHPDRDTKTAPVTRPKRGITRHDTA
jgi:hypothetical protein